MSKNAMKLVGHQVNSTFTGRYSTLSLILHFMDPIRCDVCKAIQVNKEPIEEEKKVHEEHLKGKLETKTERDKDKSKFTVCFDLKNVFCVANSRRFQLFLQKKTQCLPHDSTLIW